MLNTSKHHVREHSVGSRLALGGCRRLDPRPPRAGRFARAVCGMILLVSLLATTLGAFGRVGTQVRGFPSPGDKPEGLAFDGRYLWCNNFTDGSLYKIDPQDGSVVAHYQGGGLPTSPEGLAWDGEHLWSCHWHTGIIFKLRETSEGMEIVDSFAKPAGSGSSVGLGWDGSNLWLTCWPNPPQFQFGQIYKLDPSNGQVLAMHELPVYWIEDLAWDGTYFWSADWLFGVGFAIDVATGDTLHTYDAPGPNPVGTAWDGTHLWITDTDRDSIWALDISAGRTSVRRLDWGQIKRFFVPK